MLLERALQIKRDVYLLFTGNTKAFGKVPHNGTLELLSNIDISKKDITIIKSKYWLQTAFIEIKEFG